MDGQMETSFDPLRAWELTNLYEKAYFLSVHVVLLLLGIYSIRNRAFGIKLRPVSSAAATGAVQDQVQRKAASNQEPSRKYRQQNEQHLAWANQFVSWLFKNDASTVIEALNAWKSRINGRLIPNATNGKVQIEEIDKDDIRFEIIAITSSERDIKDQMSIIAHLKVDEMKMKINYTKEDRNIYTHLRLQSITSLLYIQLMHFNGKIKPCLKLGGISIDDNNIVLEKELDKEDAAFIQEAFKKSLQNGVILETTRGILKKDLQSKTEVKNKETQAEEPQNDESHRHILVTDLDSAIAKVASTETNMSNSKKSKPHRVLRGPGLKMPSLHLVLTPEITVQPATPLKADDEPSLFPAKAPTSDHNSAPIFLSLDESEADDFENKVEAKTEDAVQPDKDDEDKLQDGLVEDKTSISHVEELNEDQFSVSLLFNDSKTDDTLGPLEEDQLEIADAKEIVSTPVILMEEKEKANSESLMESTGSKDDRRRPRPKSLYEFGQDEDGRETIDRNLDGNIKSFEKKTRSEITRVNTFHLGSKSMVSIATPKRSNSTILRSTASQWSLTSPVGYSPSKPSALIIETDEQGKKCYYHVPPAVARKGTYEQRGVKLHAYNGHLFVAQHFNKPAPLCAVCSLPLARRMGKQGYQCRDCKMVTHKRCHTLIAHACEESSFPNLSIEYPWSTDV